MTLSNYSVEEWLEHRPLIEHLYSERKLTTDQVRNHLRGIGFHVNSRMIKTRLLNWGLHQHLHLPELRTALKTLGPDRSIWPSHAPRFRISRRVVELDDILRCCGRKGIQDPFEWIRTTSDEDYQHSSNVELLTDPTPPDSERELDDIGETSSRPPPTIPPSSAPASFAFHAARDGHETVLHRYSEVPSTVNWPLYVPDIYVHTATAVQQVQSHCLRYMTSARSPVHEEPEVHHLTCHARFLDRMDEGIALLGWGDMKLAFKRFDSGFELLKDMFMDLHPMAIATYLLLLCKLSVKKVSPVSGELLRHAHELASAVKPIPDYLVNLLRAISKSRELLEMPLLCLRAASDVMEANAPMHWKTLRPFDPRAPLGRQKRALPKLCSDQTSTRAIIAPKVVLLLSKDSQKWRC